MNVEETPLRPALFIPAPRSPQTTDLHDVTAAPPVVTGRRRPLPGWLRSYRVTAVAADLLAVGLAGATAEVVRFGTDVEPVTVVRLGLFPLLWLGVVLANGGYHVGVLGMGSEEFRTLVRAGVETLAAISFVSYAASLELSRGLVVVAVPTVVLLSCATRWLLRRRLRRRRAAGQCMRSVVAIGREKAVLELVRQLRQDRHCGMVVVGACVPDPSTADLLPQEDIPVLGDLTSAARVVRASDADTVAVMSSSETAATYLRRLSWELEGSGVELLVAPGVMEVAGPRMHVRPLIGLPLLHVEEPQFTGPRRWAKEVLDRVLAAVALILALPFIVAIAVAVRRDSPGPVLFLQRRVGRAGRPFTMIKFRTMIVDADARRIELAGRNQNSDGPLFKVCDDPRVTRVGRVLRRLSLDELPQLLNVLTGHMSLVGPRPPLPAEVAGYDDAVRRRLLVKPGLTGLWQISGRSDLSWDQSVRLDLRYVENWSPSLDLMILWKTLGAVVRGTGAY